MAKKRSSTPRRKRMNRASRLQAAKHWLPKYEGKNLVKGYRKYFGVDMLSAVAELRQLGVDIDEDYVKQLKQTMINIQKMKEQKKLRKKQEEMEVNLDPDSDYNFYYIAGYTSNGVPFGITWEEYYNDQFYYIAGYNQDGTPFGVTWHEFELSMPSEEQEDSRFMDEEVPFDKIE